MAVASGYAQAPAAAAVEHRPWWRSRPTLVALIVAVTVVVHVTASRTLTWPGSLEWSSLTHYLDNVQTWLSDQGARTHPNILYRILNGISTGLETLVRWLYDALTRLTWAGTTTFGALLTLRFGGRRAAAIMLAAFAAFGALGLWDESMHTLALMLVAGALSVAAGIPPAPSRPILMSVSLTHGGLTTLTRMPRPTNSAASVRPSERTPALLAA